MAVTEFNILADGTWGPRIAPDGTRRYQVRLEVITDSDMTGPQVLASAGMPVKYGTHADDPQAYCIDVDVEQNEDDRRYFVIDYGYSTDVKQFAQAGFTPSGGLTGGGSGESGAPPEFDDDNPLNQPPAIKLRTKLFKKLVFRDLDGNLIDNAAGDPYEATSIEVPRLVIDITRNLASFDPELIAETVGAVNVAPFWGYEERQVKCEELTADVEWKKDRTFWRVHGVFAVANAGDLMHSSETGVYWYEWKLNAGYQYLDSGTLKPIILAGGQRPARPQLLTASGGLAAVGATPIFLGFRVLPDASFAALGLFD